MINPHDPVSDNDNSNNVEHKVANARKSRNYMIAGLLVAFIVVIYLVSIMKMAG